MRGGNNHHHYQDSETTGRLGVIPYPEPISAINATLHMSSSSSAATPTTTVPSAASSDKSRAPYVSPNGSVFCSKATRPGILPMMVKEMLNTRLMIKRAMKRHCNGSPGSKVLQKVMDARQLAIKLLCNVTCK
jgi:DNA polymerase zeta